MKKTRKNNKYGKEITAILLGIMFAYGWQLFAVLMVWLESHTIMKEFLIPNIGIVIAVTPIIAWGVCGFLKVSWMDKWIRINCLGLAFLIPFMLISTIVLFIGQASLWHMPIFWAINVIVSCILAVTIFRPLIKMAKISPKK